MPSFIFRPRLLLFFAALSAGFLTKALNYGPSMIYFKEINTINGLPDNRVNSICEDEYGFIWIGTWNGLACYDGNTIRTYRHSDVDEGSLCNNMVRGLFAVGDGLWVATDTGIDFFSYADGKFYHGKVAGAAVAGIQDLSTRISRVAGTPAGDVFCVTIGGEILKLSHTLEDEDNNNCVFRIIPKPDNRVYADLCLFGDDKLMLLSNEGVTVIAAADECELLHNSMALGFDTNMNIFCDSVCSKVYVGRGIGARSQTFAVVSDNGRLERDTAAVEVFGLMEADRCGDKVFLACDGPGLYSIDDDGSLNHIDKEQSTFKADVFYAVCADRQGNLWCGSYRDGIGMLSPQLNNFNIFGEGSGLSHNIATSSVRVGDTLYVGLDGGGLDVCDLATGERRNYNASNSDLPGNNVVNLVKDGDNLYMAVYSSGLAVFNTKNHSIKTIKVPDEYFQRLWVLRRDSSGHLWIGGHGLHVMDPSTGTITTLDGCNNLSVMSIHEHEGLIYVATRLEGVLVIDSATLAVKSRWSDRQSAAVGIPSRNVEFLYVDSKGLVWLALTDKGLFSVDPLTGKMAVYSSQEGLSDSRVQSMTEDSQGNLWAGTANGLYKYVRKWKIFQRYGDERLLTNYCANAANMSDSVIYFGTNKGLVSIPTNQPVVTSKPKDVIFTELQLMLSPDKPRTLFTRGERQVALANNENFFIINFTVPETVYSEQMLFEYRLDGLEDRWRADDGRRAATYTNVPPGDYALLVRHSMPDGSWSAPASLKVGILPPWYLTWWAKTLWIILIGSVLLSAYRMWRRFYENKEKAHLVELKSEADRKLNDMRLDFYVKFIHELRTPCFLIAAQMEEMLESENGYVPVGYLKGPYRNSIKLTRIINRIIDFRKMDSGSFTLEPRKTEICAFFGDIVPDYEHLCHHKSITFSYVHDTPPIEAVFDPDKIEIAVTNLISNAFKYTRRGGSVTLTIRDLDDYIAISVSDTGIGIVESNREAIFQPYFRTERGRNECSGDGIGLSFVKELVEMHGGHIKLESEVNVGSTFTIEIPKVLSAREPSNAIAPVEPVETEPAALTDEKPAENHDMPLSNPTATRSMLIVDDDPEVINLLARTFADDYRIECASDGTEGIEKARGGDFDIVITDIVMPGLDGHALISVLKADPLTCDMRIVVFSSLSSEDDIIKAYAAKVDAFITKPASLKVLRASVDRLFDKPVDIDPNFGSMKPLAETYTREEQRFIVKCRQIIDETMCDDNFGIDLITSRLSMSHSSLYKKIRKLTGLSLIEFINEYRVYKAVQLFRGGSNNVQEVAGKCGFRDIKTFRETFKRKMKMPPKQYILYITNKK